MSVSFTEVLSLWRAGRLTEARRACLALLEREPVSADSVNLLAEIYKAEGAHREMIACLAQVTSLSPSDAAARRRLADASLATGDLPGAIEQYRIAVELEPGNARGLNNLGLALARTGDLAQATACYRRALDADPNHALAHHNLGNLLAEAGSPLQALECQRRAVALDPSLADAWRRGAEALHTLARYPEAADACEHALALRPADLATLVVFAQVLRELHRMEEALRCCERILAQRPKSLPTLYLKANLLHETADRRAAIETFEELLRIAPDHLAARVHLVNAQIPVIPESVQEVGMSRVSFAAALGALRQWLAERRPADPAAVVGVDQPFFLAYQEENNRDLLSAYGRLCVELMSDLQPDAQRSHTGRRRAPRLTVGIVSGLIREHSVFRAITKGWLQCLDRRRFRVHVFHLGVSADGETLRARALSDRFEEGPRPLGEWIGAIAASDLDALIYPEIGMHPVALQLASLRLAPVQALSWGHPETSGLPTLDYFLSAAAFESRDSAQCYSETLIRLPGIGSYTEPVAVPAAPLDLARFTLDPEGPTFLCPGTPFKYTPQHDAVLVDLARQLPRCQFVFFCYHEAALSRRLLERISARFAEAGLDGSRYLSLQPWATPGEFQQLMQQADALLDTIGFSGFNTVMLAVQCGLPVVTVRGGFMRGRFGSGILESIGLAEWVAADDADYVRRAIRLAGNRALRQSVAEQMRQRGQQLFRDRGSIEALESFLWQAVQGS
jgi:protein O-GlcNAc transferase